MVRTKIDKHVDQGGQPIRLEVDGGIKLENIKSIETSGADTFVIGSGIFNFRDKTLSVGYDKIFKDFRKALDQQQR